MSVSSQPPGSSSTNGTSGRSPPPPSPVNESPKSSPPSISPPSPPTSSSNSTSQPPSSSNGSNSPPPNPSPHGPPPDSSSSSPPLPPPPSEPTTPPPSPPSHEPPPSSAPPPPLPSHNPVPPPNTSSPPTNSSSKGSPPPPPLSPPVVASPPPSASPVPPSPPDSASPELSPPGQVVTPSTPETPPGSPLSPPLPGSPPNPSTPNPTPPSHYIPTTPSTPSDTKPPNRSPHLTPPPKHADSSSSTPTSPSSSSDSNGSFGNGAVVGVTLAGIVIALVAIYFVITRKKRRRMDGLSSHYRPPHGSFSVKSDGYYYRQANTVGQSHSDTYYASKPPQSPAGNSYGSYRGHGFHSGPPEPAGSKSWFTYEELVDITNGFSRENILGEGGFGCVYKGWLPDGRNVAVKELKAGSGQGEREFRAEVEIISRVHHRHLVSLVGYCIADHHRLLVYEFVPNKTLEHHLHGKGLPVMEWSKRVKIAIGSARGLAYLHEDCHPRIIHRDIKSANILLDDSFEAQVADFGLAKLSNDTHTHVSTRVMGTFGYMAPEYASSGKLTDRSDVFSFGVVLLELITGRRSVDPSQPLGDESLVEWARPLLVHALETGEFEEFVDSRLQNNYVKSEMFRMIEAAAACVRHSAPKRPRMVQVMRAMDNEGEMSDLTNGVKFGQSTVFESGQYSADIQKFRRMAFGSQDNNSEYGNSGEYERRSSAYSGEFHSREAPHRPLNPWRPGEA